MILRDCRFTIQEFQRLMRCISLTAIIVLSRQKAGLQKRKENNSEESERLAILLPENELAIWEYKLCGHRTDSQIISSIISVENFTLSSQPAASLQKGTFYLYLGHEWSSLTIKEAGMTQSKV